MDHKPYPMILSCIRHAHSSENEVFGHEGEDAGEHPAFDKVTALPTWKRPLSRDGVAQARSARLLFGAWRRSMRDAPALAGYASHYVRARETAGLLDLGIRWKLDVRLSERNWGTQTFLSEAELERHFPVAERYRKIDSLLWAPVGGDSMQLVIEYLHSFLETLSRDCSENEVVLVSHGEAMHGLQYILDHWLPEDLGAAMTGQGERQRITNCLMMQYSRIDAEGNVHPHYVRKRFLDLLGTTAELETPWRPVPAERTFSGEELLSQIADIERHV